MIDETIPKELQEIFDMQDKEMVFIKETGMIPPRHIDEGLRDLHRWMCFQGVVKASFDVTEENKCYSSYLNYINDPIYKRAFIKELDGKIEIEFPQGTTITINKG